MRKTKTVTETTEETTIICDYCNKTKDYIKTCFVCSKDVCFGCSEQTDGDRFKDGFTSDYPDYCCKKCWQLGKLIRERVEQERQTLEIVEEKAFEEWKQIVKQGGYEHVYYQCDRCNDYFAYPLDSLFSEQPKKNTFHKNCPNNGVIRRKVELKDYPDERA